MKKKIPLMIEFSAEVTAWKGESMYYIVIACNNDSNNKPTCYVGDQNGYDFEFNESDIYEMIDDFMRKRYGD